MTIEEAFSIAHDYGVEHIEIDFDGSYYDVKANVYGSTIGTASQPTLEKALDEMIASIMEDVE